MKFCKLRDKFKQKKFQSLYFVFEYWFRDIKGGYFDFSHLTESKNIYITEIYMKKKQYKSSFIKNHRITKKKKKKKKMMVFP